MEKNKFVHIVNFWLKTDLTESEIKDFETNIKNLEKIESINYFNVGKPADIHRPVVDRTYSYCVLIVFPDKAGHDLYQEHPLHKKFLDSCKHLWDKVLIYDSETIA